MPKTFDVVSTREFPVSATQAWRAWRDPEYVRQWWGPAGFTCPSAELDFRVGGASLLCMRAPAEFGMPDMYTTWTYRRIEPTSLIEFDHAFTDAKGTGMEGPPGVPPTVRHVVTFTPAESGTSVTVTEFGYPNEQVRDQSRVGLEQCLDKLADLFRTFAVFEQAAVLEKGVAACSQPSST